MHARHLFIASLVGTGIAVSCSGGATRTCMLNADCNLGEVCVNQVCQSGTGGGGSATGGGTGGGSTTGGGSATGGGSVTGGGIGGIGGGAPLTNTGGGSTGGGSATGGGSVTGGGNVGGGNTDGGSTGGGTATGGGAGGGSGSTCSMLLQDCPTGQGCVLLNPATTICVSVGTATEGQSCSANPHACAPGYFCNQAKCTAICDPQASTCANGVTCTSGPTMNWGICLASADAGTGGGGGTSSTGGGVGGGASSTGGGGGTSVATPTFTNCTNLDNGPTIRWSSSEQDFFVTQRLSSSPPSSCTSSGYQFVSAKQYTVAGQLGQSYVVWICATNANGTSAPLKISVIEPASPGNNASCSAIP